MTMIYLIDPPQGWRYGFPKEIPKDLGEKCFDKDKRFSQDIEDWVIKNGYPATQKSLIKYSSLTQVKK